MDIKNSFVKKALLIDDCDTDNFVHKNFILSSRFATEVIIRKNSLEAIKYLNSLNSVMEDYPDIIFLDINMPLYSGFDFLGHFENYSNEIKSRCNIVILSTSENPKDINAMALNPLIKDYIYKPLTKNELEKLRKKLGSGYNFVK